MGSEIVQWTAGYTVMSFQLTLPVRGVTVSTFCASVSSLFQSTLPVWGVTPLYSSV